jgi:hypothetical protein
LERRDSRQEKFLKEDRRREIQRQRQGQSASERVSE